MSHPAKPKWVIECQLCHDSLTIVYTTIEDETTVRRHLAQLMEAHMKHVGEDLIKPPDGVPSDPAKWVRKIRPATE